MLARRSDSGDIADGDEFMVFSGSGHVFTCGHVDAISAEHVEVDFGDYRLRYNRQTVFLMEENCGYIRSFYASTQRGVLIETFR